MLPLNVKSSFRAAGYAAILLIGVLSLVPGTLRPETGAPGQFEHFVAYQGSAIFLTLGSDKAIQRWQGLWLAPLAAAVETAQLFIPGRHSCLSDFAVSTLGTVFGIVLAFGIAPTMSRMLVRPPNSIGPRMRGQIDASHFTEWPNSGPEGQSPDRLALIKPRAEPPLGRKFGGFACP